MMKMRMWITAVLLALLLIEVVPVQAQSKRKAAKSSGGTLISLIGSKVGNEEEIEGTGYRAYLSLTPKDTPTFLLVEHQETKSKNTRKNEKPWIEIAIPFKTKINPNGTDRWLENVSIKVELMTPILSDRQKATIEWGVLSGTATLAPIANVARGKNKYYSGYTLFEKDGYCYHIIRFFISPAAVSRFLLLPEMDVKTLREMVPGMPVRVTFTYDKEEFTAVSAMSKNYIKIVSKSDAFKKMKVDPKEDSTKDTLALFAKYDDSPRSYFVIENTILPTSKTPWAWLDYDRQEHTLDDSQRSR